jgi:hypothetical protein
MSKKERIIENFKNYGSIQEQPTPIYEKLDEPFTTFEQFRDKRYTGNAEVIYGQKPYKIEKFSDVYI